MSQFNRYLWTGLVLGLAACGDDVTVTNPPEPVVPTPGVTSVSVAPDGATIVVNAKLGMTAAATLEPGAAAPTWTWSTSSSAVATVTGTTATAEVTAVAVGSAGIRATATSGTSSASGVATVTVVAAPVTPSCAITGVSVSPSSANLVVGQTVAVAANVSGTNCSAAQLGVNYSTSDNTVASVSGTGVVTANAAGSVTITATSATDASKKAAMSVSIVAPQPATVSIQSVTQGTTNTPVNLANVGGQVEITLNVDPGAGTVSKAQALINGVVVAEQIIPAAAAEAAPSLAPQTLVLSTNTRQVKSTAGAYTPVVFNGPGQITARIYTAASTTPVVSNAIPVVMLNQDAITKPTAWAATNATPAVTVAGTTYRTGTLSFSGGQYIAFYPTGMDSLKVGSTVCGTSANALSGSPTAGYSYGGTLACTGATGATGAGFNTVNWWATAQTAPDIARLQPTTIFETVGTAYTVDGSTRYNLFGSPTGVTAVFIDNTGPTTTANPIGFLSGAIGAGDAAPANCEETYALANGAGCWVNASYTLGADFTHADAGVGAPTGGFVTAITAYGTTACTSTAFDLATAAASSLPTAYDVCGNAADALGNTGTRVRGFNPFGVDNTAPTLTYGGATGAPPLGGALYAQLVSGCANSALTCTNPPVAATTAGAGTLSFDITDDAAGVDSLNNSGLKATFSYTVNNGGTALAVSAASTTFNATTMPCVRPNTATTSLTTTIRRITTAFAPDNGCALPGEYTFSVVGQDRAGNSTSAYVRKMELNGPAGASAPTVTAVNLLPLYAASSDISFDIFAADNEDLRSASIGLSYVTSAGNSLEVVFGPAAGFYTGIFGTSWDGSLYLNTPTSGSRLTLPAAYNLRGYADNAGVLAGTPPWATTGINFRVYDSYLGALANPYGTPSVNFTQVLPAPFLTTSSWTGVTNTTNPWASGTGVSNPTFSGAGACTWTYETPTNDPQVVDRLWVANYVASSPTAGTATILADISATPVLVSDNGTTRVYRHSISASTCATFIGGAGTKLAIAVKSGAGYVFPAQ